MSYHKPGTQAVNFREEKPIGKQFGGKLRLLPQPIRFSIVTFVSGTFYVLYSFIIKTVITTKVRLILFSPLPPLLQRGSPSPSLDTTALHPSWNTVTCFIHFQAVFFNPTSWAFIWTVHHNIYGQYSFFELMNCYILAIHREG